MGREYNCQWRCWSPRLYSQHRALYKQVLPNPFAPRRLRGACDSSPPRGLTSGRNSPAPRGREQPTSLELLAVFGTEWARPRDFSSPAIGPIPRLVQDFLSGPRVCTCGGAWRRRGEPALAASRTQRVPSRRTWRWSRRSLVWAPGDRNMVGELGGLGGVALWVCGSAAGTLRAGGHCGLGQGGLVRSCGEAARGAGPGLGHPHHLGHNLAVYSGSPTAKRLPGEWTLREWLPLPPRAPPCVARGQAGRGCPPISLLWGKELVGEPRVRPKARRPI